MEPRTSDPPAQRFTRIYHGQRELIDHILVSHTVVRGDMTTDELDIPSIGDTPTARRDEPGSDHRPVAATLQPN